MLSTRCTGSLPWGSQQASPGGLGVYLARGEQPSAAWSKSCPWRDGGTGLPSSGGHHLPPCSCQKPAPNSSPQRANASRSWGHHSFIGAGSVPRHSHVWWGRGGRRSGMSYRQLWPHKGNGMERPRTGQRGSGFLNSGEGGRACFLAGRPPATCPSRSSWAETPEVTATHGKGEKKPWIQEPAWHPVPPRMGQDRGGESRWHPLEPWHSTEAPGVPPAPCGCRRVWVG